MKVGSSPIHSAVKFFVCYLVLRRPGREAGFTDEEPVPAAVGCFVHGGQVSKWQGLAVTSRRLLSAALH